MSEKPVVELKGVSKEYRQGAITVQALKDLDLRIERGEFTVICGPSGSGKTTLLNLIGALDSPSGGQIMVDGHEVTKLGRKALSQLRRDRIGFVFQAYNLLPVLTAFENAESVLALQGKDAAERHKVVSQVLQEVGLSGLESRRPDQLSGGQQQRVAIARAIASEPAIVLADEPTANVDSETAEKLLDIMQKLNEERGVTFLFSTHDPRVMKRARRIVTLVDGRIESDEVRAEASPQEV